MDSTSGGKGIMTEVGKLVKRDNTFYLDVDFGIVGQQPFQVVIHNDIAHGLLVSARQVVNRAKVSGEVQEVKKARVLTILNGLIDEFDE